MRWSPRPCDPAPIGKFRIWFIPSLRTGKSSRTASATLRKANAFEQVDLPRYYVPLTPIGHAALKLGLHHNLTELLPESVTARLRKVRNNWHNHKFHIESESL